MKRRYIAAVAGLSFLAASMQPVVAATTSGTLLVSATVLNTCIVVAAPLLFGNYSPSDASDLDAATAITVTCTIGTAYNVGLDKGANGSSVTDRSMKFGTELLNYQIFKDAGRTQNWGNTVGNDTVAKTAGLLPDIIPVYGRITKNQNVSAGLYGDSVLVTVTY